MSTNYKNINKVSKDIKTNRLDELKKILPEVFTEGKVDLEKLKLALGQDIDERPERFNFSWAGKSKAIKTVLIPSKATLKPAKGESIKFDESENMIIEGDNLEVLKLFQKNYFGQVKMIYIDPPYNTGGDFVYHDDFKSPINSYFKQTGQLNEEGNKTDTINRETNGRYHSDWLSMMYPRLKLAWNLLKDDGVIFVSIDDNEIQGLRLIMNEIFGEENFIDCIIWKKRYGGGSKEKYLVTVHEYVLFYAKQINQINNIEVPVNEESIKRYYTHKDENFSLRGPYRIHPLEAGRVMEDRENLIFPIIAPDGSKINPRRQWLWSKQKVEDTLKFGELEFNKTKQGWVISTKQYLKDRKGIVRKTKAFSLIGDIYTEHGTEEIITLLGNGRIFPYPKPSIFIERLLEIGSDKNDLILDFFAGSGTTAHAVMAQNTKDGGNRKFILVQLPEPTSPDSEAYKAGYKTIADITKERARRVIKGYGDNPKPINNGFKVFKLAPSNYPDISYEFDPSKTEEENQKSFSEYLTRAQQTSLLDKSIEPINIVYENIVKEGFSLNSKIVESSVDGNHLFIVTDGESEMRICLDKEISAESVKKLSSFEFKGKTFVCYDNALSDSDKANISLNLGLKTI